MCFSQSHIFDLKGTNYQFKTFDSKLMKLITIFDIFVIPKVCKFIHNNRLLSYKYIILYYRFNIHIKIVNGTKKCICKKYNNMITYVKKINISTANKKCQELR